MTLRIDEDSIFHPVRDETSTEETLAEDIPAGYDFEEFTFETDDGCSLYAVLLRNTESTFMVFFFGGNMFSISQRGLHVIERLPPLHVNLVLSDYRGSGRSTGEPNIDNIESDALLLYDRVQDILGKGTGGTIVHGRSLGSFVAARHAMERPVSCLVLEGSATTSEEWARKLIPQYFKPFVRVKITETLRNQGHLEPVRRIECPLLILVGDKDQTTPPELSRRLCEETAVPDSLKEIHIFRGAGHNDVMDHPEFLSVYEKFLISIKGRVVRGTHEPVLESRHSSGSRTDEFPQ